MSIVDVAPPFAKLNFPSVEEYRQRKVALISGMHTLFLPLTLTWYAQHMNVYRYNRTRRILPVSFEIHSLISSHIPRRELIMHCVYVALSCCSKKAIKSTASSAVRRVSTRGDCIISTRTNMSVSIPLTSPIPSPKHAHGLTPAIHFRPQQIQAPLRRSQRQHQSRVHHRPGPAYRSLQPRRPITRQSILRNGRIHRGRRRARYPTSIGCHPYMRIRKAHQVLSGFYLRTLRQSRRDTAERDDSLLPSLTIRVREAVCVLDCGELQGGVWDVCV